MDTVTVTSGRAFQTGLEYSGSHFGEELSGRVKWKELRFRNSRDMDLHPDPATY